MASIASKVSYIPPFSFSVPFHYSSLWLMRSPCALPFPLPQLAVGSLAGVSASYWVAQQQTALAQESTDSVHPSPARRNVSFLALCSARPPLTRSSRPPPPPYSYPSTIALQHPLLLSQTLHPCNLKSHSLVASSSPLTIPFAFTHAKLHTSGSAGRTQLKVRLIYAAVAPRSP